MSILRSSEAQFLFEIPGTEFRIVDFTVIERISSAFRVDLTLASEDEINFDDVINKEALLTILSEDTDRYHHGIISEFKQIGYKGRFFLYQTRMVPSLWLLSLEQNCRIFQKKNVKDIIQQILLENRIPSDRFEFRLTHQYQNREYCVQYREKDMDFICRLMEEEGIFYFFEHYEDKHLLIFGDSTVNYPPMPGNAAVLFHSSDAMVPEEEVVYAFIFSRQIRSGKYTLKDFNFEKPSLDLTAFEQNDFCENLEVYDYPGEYMDECTGKNLAKIRLQEVVMHKNTAAGKSACPRFTPGYTFTLADHERDDFNQEYLITEVIHKGTQPQVFEEVTDSGRGFSYFNEFMGIPSSVTFRPERKTPKPFAKGLQTAIVVGPSGEEIYTDKYGRVKVQFHWDREGETNENSSCWIRVASTFAGSNYGFIFTPRIGQEVIVDFLEGNPDRPIIIGSVYNANTMPPYQLPDEKTKSTIKTNSSIGGEGFNEIRFEDAKGEEEIFIHAEKDLNLQVNNDRRESIGNDRHLIVGRDKYETVESDTHVTIKRDELREIKRDRNLKVIGKEAVAVEGSRSLTVNGDVIEIFKGNHSEQVSQDYYIKCMNAVVEAMTGLTIKVGSSFITINSGGIFIKGPIVHVNGAGSALSGTSGRAVSPAQPQMESVDDSPRHQEPEEDDEERSWIEIELVDEDNQPVTGERYRVTLPDGITVAEGTTGPDGVARVTGIDPGMCRITFPNLDKDAWEKI